MTPGPRRRPARLGPIAAGGALALASAVAFGMTTPLVQRAGRGAGPFATAALLYAGAALFSSWRRPDAPEPPLRAGDVPRLAAVSALGAVAAPVALAWGLQRTSGVTAALLLTLEGLFTVLLARALWAEPIGSRVALALVAMTGGGAMLVAHGRASSLEAGWGALAVVTATLGWAGDNVISRPLADRNPAAVVRFKGGLGAVASTALACAFRDAWPRWAAALALLACGAVGFGASLRLYLRAQRAIGAARTGSIFACAPFVGAAIAWAMGERPGGAVTFAAGALCATGVALHLTERHEHEHRHDAIEHEHAHRHDEGHHGHSHDSYPEGTHSHPHRHEAVTHAHPHGLDPHHRHRH